MIVLVALVAAVSAQFCRPHDRNPQAPSGAQVPVSNGFLEIGELVHKPHFGATNIRTLGAQDGELVIDSRSPGDITHHGTHFQLLECEVSDTLYAGPTPFPHGDVAQQAGLLATGDDCVTVKDGAVSLERCATTADSIAPQWFHIDGPFVVYAGDANATAAAATVKNERVVSLTEPKGDRYAVLALRDSPAGNTPHDMIGGPDMAVHESKAAAHRPLAVITGGHNGTHRHSGALMDSGIG